MTVDAYAPARSKSVSADSVGLRLACISVCMCSTNSVHSNNLTEPPPNGQHHRALYNTILN